MVVFDYPFDNFAYLVVFVQKKEKEKMTNGSPLYKGAVFLTNPKEKDIIS